MTAPAIVSLATMTALMFGFLRSIELNTRPAVGASQLTGLLGHARPARRLAQHAVVALREQRGVVVGRGAVDVDVLDRLLALDLRALGQRRALHLADLDVVEGHVEGRAAARGEPVVVDGDDAGLLGLLLDRRTGRRVEVDDHEDLDAVRPPSAGRWSSSSRLSRWRSGCRRSGCPSCSRPSSAVGSAVTQRGEDVVSGRMMPTLAPLPSTVPPVDDDEDDDDEVVDEVLPPACDDGRRG